jgi:metal-dependent amidase/aminoacylase/carboxypeptidase family protein
MTDLKQKAYDAIDKIATHLDKISKDIWENPEENFEEVKAHANITTFLVKKGFQVERNYITKTGFR